MQNHNAHPDPSADSPVAYDNGVVNTPVAASEPYVHPTIPLGLPHVVQFVEASMHHLPMSVRFLGDRMSRYANAQGVVSMAVPFICQITGLGSKNTAEHHIRLMVALGVLEKRPGKGGHNRKSNTYVFLGEQRNWKPLPTERPGTDPWIALAQARREIEELRAEIARLKNGGAVSHSRVTDGYGAEAPEPTSHSYGNPGIGASTEAHGAIGHSRVTDGQEAEAHDPAPHSYGNPGIDSSTEAHGAIGHSRVTDGQEAEAPEPTSHSYETPDFSTSTEAHGAIGHSRVTDGSAESMPKEPPRSHEAPDPEPWPKPQETTGHSEVTGEPDEGRQYLSRRARVEALVLEHRPYYDRSFRGGVLTAIEYFSRSAENEAELNRQAGVLRAGRDPSAQDAGPPKGNEGQSPRVNPETGRREVEFCPDCNSPYTTFNGEERCPDCTDRRRREREA